jgi:quercetin dioxygenase-like cupin family protein
MKPQIFGARRIGLLALSLTAMGCLLSPSTVSAQASFVITPVVEKKITELPDGPLYWQVENFPALAQAQAAAGPTALAAEAEGRVWLFTLGPKGAPTHGGSMVVEVGPVARITAPEYLLRVNNAVAPPGTKTAVHTHAGSEAFYVLAGQLSQRTPQGVSIVEVGQTMPGRGPDTTMEVSSTGTTDMHALVMFVVDATKPFSSPATFQ